MAAASPRPSFRPFPGDAPGDWLVVYGTLKQEQVNHHWLAGFPCHGSVSVASFVLHDLGPFPMAVHGPGHLFGELYRVDAATLVALDRLEGVPRLYQRWRCRPVGAPWAWIYVGTARQVRHSPRVVDGWWTGGRLTTRQDGEASGAVLPAP
ncbi:MAG: gamma-glutamylcyclotransferase [Cyanobacteriota bacterium]